jgi:hypothetical protein
MIERRNRSAPHLFRGIDMKLFVAGVSHKTPPGTRDLGQGHQLFQRFRVDKPFYDRQNFSCIRCESFVLYRCEAKK